jgi:hypothetical protein
MRRAERIVAAPAIMGDVVAARTATNRIATGKAGIVIFVPWPRLTASATSTPRKNSGSLSKGTGTHSIQGAGTRALDMTEEQPLSNSIAQIATSHIERAAVLARSA